MTHLPPINRQVDTCATLLGKAISHSHGEESLMLIEELRQKASKTRGVDEFESYDLLIQLQEHIAKLRPQQKLMIAKAFAIYLAIINSCENAYRTSRLKKSMTRETIDLQGCLIYVLTAHPTEIRSTPSISIIRRLITVLTQWFLRGPETNASTDEFTELSSLIRLLWHVGIHKDSPVTPIEEVDHIASQFSNEILSEVLRLRRNGADIRFRTWVGGDKDGHPGINAATLHTSFRRTRQRLYQFVENRLNSIKTDLLLLGDTIAYHLKQVERALMDVRQVKIGDGIRMNTLHRTISSLCEQVKNLIGELPLPLIEIFGILELFPGLVLPVELREESTIFIDLQRKQAIGTIGKMLRKANHIAEGGKLQHYIQGLIISMTRSISDIEATLDVVNRTIGKAKIPIIPLFERGQDLNSAPKVIKDVLENQLPLFSNPKEMTKKLEIMVGYSDTSKRMGAFASRRHIFKTMFAITEICKKYRIEPIFFHGAGGSVTRGGGSIEEQFAAWPQEARKIIKLTVQGEMVERTFATPEIFYRNVERLLRTAQSIVGKVKPPALSDSTLDQLAVISADTFEELINDKHFHQFIAQATPYPDLCVLNVGSRPSHRPGKETSADLSSLRAIPWVLCFTQVRLLVPSWYGIGTAFQALSKNPKQLTALKNAYASDMAFRGFIKLMGFSLAKGDRAVFKQFSHTLANPPELVKIKKKLLDEEKRVSDMVRLLSGQDSHLWFRPWLAESILLRGSTIHPLSIIELLTLKDRRQNLQSSYNEELLRVSISGVAVGMLTTG